MQNGGKARSQGVDFQGQFRPIQPVTLTLNVGYTDAKYVDPVAGPRRPVAGVLPSINRRRPLRHSEVAGVLDRAVRLRPDRRTRRLSARRLSVAIQLCRPRHLRGRHLQPLYARRARARPGERPRRRAQGPLEVNVFANNLLDGKDKIGNAGIGISGCRALNRTCSTFTQFTPFVNQNYQRPREIGVQVNYRF